MRFEALLGRTVRGFWASTYSFDLKLFDQYVLRRLAPSPLNAVVLADRDKLATVWEGLHEGQEYLARQVGRRYLLRGVAPPGGGAFHPKTYLFARADHATLIIGSGNLTRPGIDGGREVFTLFTTQRSEDLPTMRVWARWMGRLVHRQVDPLLLERWTALREASPWITGDSDGSRFLSNDDESLLDQLARRLPGDIDDLHVTAPFFDPSADALRQLIKACSAKRLTLYVGAGAKVHGPALAGVLADHPNARVRRFEPQTFVHAKLIGITVGGQGLLLSGSPNLSHAALTLTHADNGGNDEVAVLSEGTAAQVRDVFNGSGLDQIDEALDWLTSLTFADDHPAGAHALVLRSAQWRDDGRVQVRLGDGHALPSDAMLGWEAAQRAAPLDEHGVTHEALDEADTSPVIVYIVDSDGAILSNRVVIDDPGALRETLVGSAAKRSTRPRELEDSEMVPSCASCCGRTTSSSSTPTRTPHSAAPPRPPPRTHRSRTPRGSGSGWPPRSCSTTRGCSPTSRWSSAARALPQSTSCCASSKCSCTPRLPPTPGRRFASSPPLSKAIPTTCRVMERRGRWRPASGYARSTYSCAGRRRSPTHATPSSTRTHPSPTTRRCSGSLSWPGSTARCRTRRRASSC